MKKNSVAELILTRLIDFAVRLPSFEYLTHVPLYSRAERRGLPLEPMPATPCRRKSFDISQRARLDGSHLPWWTQYISSIWITSQHENHNCCLPTDPCLIIAGTLLFPALSDQITNATLMCLGLYNKRLCEDRADRFPISSKVSLWQGVRPRWYMLTDTSWLRFLFPRNRWSENLAITCLMQHYTHSFVKAKC